MGRTLLIQHYLTIPIMSNRSRGEGLSATTLPPIGDTAVMGETGATDGKIVETARLSIGALSSFRE